MDTAFCIWWQPCAGGARVLRVAGDTPCPALPGALDGVPVTEIGPYCFAGAQRPLPADARRWGAGSAHVLCGSFLEELTLPDAVHTLHNAAFYDCRRLRRLCAGPRLAALGSDLFTNCRALGGLALRAAPSAPTGLKKLLGALPGDIEVRLEGGGATARLFYPEYWEVLDENAPAHLFDRGVEGEGYRYRQCFADGAVDYAAYDAVFPLAAVREAPAKLCRLALGRLLAPYALGAAARGAYERYLCAHAAQGFAAAAGARDAAALRLLCGLGLPARLAAEACVQAGWGAGMAVAAGGAPARKRYEFEEL